MSDRPLPGWPRGMPVDLAAAYIGVSATVLRREADAGRAPKPIRITEGRVIWLLDDLDAWLDRLGGRKHAAAVTNTWD